MLGPAYAVVKLLVLFQPWRRRWIRMFDEIRYRWALRKYLNERQLMKRSYKDIAEKERSDDEPDYKFALGRDLGYLEAKIDEFRSRYLVEQAYLYHVPIPKEEDDWTESRHSIEPFLTDEAAQKLRAAIRSEQKANWDYLAGRITLAIAAVGCVFGVLAYFKK